MTPTEWLLSASANGASTVVGAVIGIPIALLLERKRQTAATTRAANATRTTEAKRERDVCTQLAAFLRDARRDRGMAARART